MASKRFQLSGLGGSLTGLLLMGFLLISVTSQAWNFNTHRKIAADALKRMPPSFQTRLGSYKDTILKGATDPDTILKDFQNHVYHIHSLHPDKSQVSVLRFQELFQLIAELLKGKESIGSSNASLKAALNQRTVQTQNEQIAYQLGLYSHYIADINQPLHTDGGEVDPREVDYHMKFEKDVESQLSKIPLGPYSVVPVTDPAERMLTMAKASNERYLEIGIAYREGRKILDLQDLLKVRYNAAVQAVIDFWYGVFQAGGQPLEPLQAVPNASGPLALDLLVVEKPQSQGPIVNLNTASLEELMKLPMVGAKKAQAIINARPFKSTYDLAKVKGFGVRLVEKIADRLSVDP